MSVAAAARHCLQPLGESDRSIQSVDDPRVLPDLFPIDTPEGEPID